MKHCLKVTAYICLLSVSYVLVTALMALSNLIFTTSLWVIYTLHFSNFTGWEAEGLRGSVTCPPGPTAGESGEWELGQVGTNVLIAACGRQSGMKEDVLACRHAQVKNCCRYRQVNYQQVIHPEFSGVVQEGTVTVGMKEKGSWQTSSHDI